MKKTIVRTALAVVFAIGLITSMAAPAHAWDRPCSLAGAAGNWSLTDQGTVVGVGPRTAVGVFTLDGAGNLTNGVATSSLNGSIADETYSGTYTVNSNCTGTFNVTIYSSGTELFVLTANMAFDDDMREMRAIFTSATEPNGTVLPTVINLEARKQ
ncbi:MAG TPA: hypothetical protein VEG68_02415 [Terriglobales bacterium]|nr:hypothetical protein [Terriglobales bacterium]